MKTSAIIAGVILAIIAIPCLILGGIFIHGCSAATGLVHNGIDTAAAIVTPSEMLKKYEWFKDASAQCDKKMADIQVYESRFKQLKSEYAGVMRDKWSREDREQYNMWLDEVSGLQASYNALAADYNSAMSKFNYRFCNVGDLPQGATQPLPREVKPYTLGN